MKGSYIDKFLGKKVKVTFFSNVEKVGILEINPAKTIPPMYFIVNEKEKSSFHKSQVKKIEAAQNE